MGPKRAAKSKAKSEKPAKKAKVSGFIDTIATRWEYEADKDKWIQFSKENSDAITDAYNAGQNKIEVEVTSGVTMVVQTDKMAQKNKKTGWERPLRIAVDNTASGNYYVWLWTDEKGKQNAYDAKVSVTLEKALAEEDRTVDIEACHRSYTVDLSKMKQTNTVSNVSRKVERVKSVAETVKTEEKEPGAVASTSAAATKSTSRRGKSAKVKEEPMEEEEEEESKAAKSGGKSKAKSGAKERPAVKTVVMTGKAPVDPECTTLVGKAHVFYEGSDVWDCMLNQTNVSNNNNKYFLIQLLEADGKKSYYTWFRWGRVGYKGQNNLVPCGPNLEAAKKAFMKKFSDKTGNVWANRKSFVKHPGKYDLLEMDYSTKDADETDAAPSLEKKKSLPKTPDSKLDKRLQSLIELICDVKSMEEAVVEMKYDAKKAPLGKLTTDQIKAGYAALKKIDICINKNDFGSTLTQACDEYYTRIPHDFGMRPPTTIRTKEQLKSEISLLEALGDIQIAIKMLKMGDMTENPVDRHYHSLNCDLDPVDHRSDEFKMIDKYLQNTHAATHNQYKMKILDLYDVSKHGEAEKFNDCGNRMLLWHGSRLTNWVGILSQGLRIAPPEAPVTGYMFGKGVYFADMSSKSANYCFASRAKKTGLLLLCDVALGQCNELLAADYAANKLPTGKHSVKGVGKIAPDPTQLYVHTDGLQVPWGKGKDMGIVNPKGYTLNYNEFIVYNTNQIRMKYLLKVEFNFR